MSCEPLDPENEKLLRDLFAGEADDHLTRRLFETVDQLRAREARLREVLTNQVVNQASDRTWCQLCRTEQRWPYNDGDRAKHLHKVGCVLDRALASSPDAPAETTWRNCLMRSSAAGEPVRCGKALTEWADHSWRCPDGHYNAVADLRREYLGRLVREVWVVWAKDQDHPKPHHLLPWEQISENDREVDRRIGETLLGIRDWRNGQRPVRTVEQAMSDATPAESPGELTAALSEIADDLEGWGNDGANNPERKTSRADLTQAFWDMAERVRACAARAKGRG